MQVLVTGTTGFIGSHITNALIEKGHKVIGISRIVNNDEKDNVNFIKLDVLYKQELTNKLSNYKIDAIVNCIGLLGRFGTLDTDYFRTNVEATKNLLEFAKLKNVKHFIHISSCGVVGPIERSECPADETYPPTPSNIYEKTKLLGENEVKTSGINYTILRPEFVYGPGDMHLLGFFKTINSGYFILINGGETYLHPTYIDDVIFGVMQAFLNPASYNQTFNLCGEKYVSVRNLIEIISNALNIKVKLLNMPSYILLPLARIMELAFLLKIDTPLIVSRIKFFSENRAFSYQKAQNLIEFKPTVTIEEGFTHTIRWYLENGYL